MVALAKTQLRMSVAEFLDWNPTDSRRWQLIDGEPRAMAPANAVHAYLQAELGRVIGNHLRASGRACDVFTNPGVVPATMAAHNMRVPDLAVGCSPFDLNQAAPANPVLIVEILSPGNRADTWANVWAYTSIPSVREILVLRADAIGGDLLRRLPDASWPDRPTVIGDDDLVLDSIGFRVALSDLYGRTPLTRR
jgi:Uma2 family endonuclease